MTITPVYDFIGNGVAQIAECDEITGDPKDFDELGNVSQLSLGFSQNRVTRRNYQRKGNPISKAANITTDASLSFTATNLDRRIMKLYFSGSEFDITAGTVTAEPLPFNLTDAKWANDDEDALLSLKNVNVDLATAPVLKYGTVGAVNNVVPAANYTVDRAGNVRVKASYLATLTKPDATHWTIDYAYKASQGFAAGSRVSGCTKRFWLKISGNNLAECGSGEYQVTEIYKVVLTPEGSLDFISEDFSELAFTGLVLLDDTRPEPATGTADQWEEYFRVIRYGE